MRLAISESLAFEALQNRKPVRPAVRRLDRSCCGPYRKAQTVIPEVDGLESRTGRPSSLAQLPGFFT
jgi:hypothetical protein